MPKQRRASTHLLESLTIHPLRCAALRVALRSSLRVSLRVALLAALLEVFQGPLSHRPSPELLAAQLVLVGQVVGQHALHSHAHGLSHGLRDGLCHRLPPRGQGLPRHVLPPHVLPSHARGLPQGLPSRRLPLVGRRGQVLGRRGGLQVCRALLLVVVVVVWGLRQIPPLWGELLLQLRAWGLRRSR